MSENTMENNNEFNSELNSENSKSDQSALPAANFIAPDNRFADVISGQFDADEDTVDAPPLKRVLLPQAESPKLHKVLAQAGMGSRLEMEQLILEGPNHGQ